MENRRFGPRLFLMVWAMLAVVPFFGEQGTVFYPLIESLACLGKAAWFWLLVMGLGWRGLRLFKVFDDSIQDSSASFSRLILSCGMGLGILSTAVLMFGAWVGVGQKEIFILMVLLIVAVGPGWLDLMREIRVGISQIKAGNWRWEKIGVAGLVIGIACLQLPAALTPTIYPDTWRYHFGLTRLFQQEGGIRIIPDFAEANMASTWQMVYLPILTLCGDTTAQVFNWMVFPLTAGGVALAAGEGAGAIAALTLVSTPVLLGVASLANNDLGAAFFTALTWLTLARPTHSSSLILHPFNKWILVGCFAGLSISTKYTSASLFVAVFCGLALFEPEARERRCRGLLLFCMGAFLSYLPWFIRNGLGTGDPFYPMLGVGTSAFQSEAHWVREHYQKEIMIYGDETRNPLKLLLVPWHLTMGDRHYFEIGPGLIYWCAAPLVAWAAWRERGTRLAAGATLIGGLTWALVAQVSRFMAPLIPSAAIAVGGGWRECSLSGKGGKLQVLKGLGLVLVGINVWQTMTALSGFSDPWHYLLQGQKHDEYLSANSPLYRTSQWIRRHDPQAKVLLFGEEGIFVMESPFKLSGPFDRKWLVDQVAASRNSDEMTHRLRDAGVGFLLVNDQNIEGFEHHFGYAGWPSPQARKNFKDYLGHTLPMVWQDGPIRVYRVPSK